MTKLFLALLLCASLAACGDGGPDTGQPNDRVSYVDEFGRNCTQVSVNGYGIALDCDYPERK